MSRMTRLPGLPRWVNSAPVFWLGTIFLPFLLYLRTMAPTVYGLDSAELTTGAYTLGIVHAPGSPLFLLLGWLFAHLPMGDVGYRLNLMTGCFAVLGVGFTALLIRRLTSQPLAAWLCSLWLACTYYYWISALAAELYAPTVCFLAAVLWLLAEWQYRARRWLLWLAAWLFGLGLGIHLMLALAAPGLVCIALAGLLRHAALQKRSFWQAALSTAIPALLCVLLGMGVYLYLPLRYLSDAPLNYARDYWQVNLATWDGFWWMLTGRMFAPLMVGVPAAGLLAELGRYAYQMWSNFTALGVAAGLWGMFALWRRDRIWAAALVFIFLAHLAFYIPYAVADKEVMFLPTYLIWTIWIAAAATDVRIHRKMPVGANAQPVLTAALVVMIVFTLGFNMPLTDLSQDRSARAAGETLLRALPPNAWIYGTWADIPILEYLQIVEGQRPDVTARNLFFIGAPSAQQEMYPHLLQKQPVWTSAPGLFTYGNGFAILKVLEDPLVYEIVLR